MFFVLETNKMALCRAYMKDGKVIVVHFVEGVDIDQHWQNLSQGNPEMDTFIQLDSSQLPPRKGAAGDNLRDTWQIVNGAVVVP